MTANKKLVLFQKARARLIKRETSIPMSKYHNAADTRELMNLEEQVAERLE